jgi:hypothetical protein
MAAMRSIESNHDNDDIRDECLSSWEQSSSADFAMLG